MLREPGSRYEVGRSTTLFKVKTFHDAEAVVLEHLPAKVVTPDAWVRCKLRCRTGFNSLSGPVLVMPSVTIHQR